MSAPDIRLLDGATGTELRRRGVKVPSYQDSIWSALALIEAPEAVAAVHADYIAAGADIITTNNYAVTPPLLARRGLADEVEPLTRLAGELARRAAAMSGARTRVAGSLPPLSTTYRPDLVGAFVDILPAYRTIVRALAPYVDLLLCETMSTAEEARAAATAACEAGLPVWVSWTLSPEAGRMLDGGTLGQAVRHLDGLPVEVFLVNCCPTDAVAPALAELRAATDRPLGAYANHVRRACTQAELDGEAVPALSPAEYARIGRSWQAAGATVVGGCCGTTPAHIAALAEQRATDAGRAASPLPVAG